jgi:hypothetical protein
VWRGALVTWAGMGGKQVSHPPCRDEIDVYIL